MKAGSSWKQVKHKDSIHLLIRAAATAMLTLGCAFTANAHDLSPQEGQILAAPLANQDRVVQVAAEQEKISFSLSLPYRNQADLDELLVRVYKPGDPLFHRFLTPQEFTARFGPSQQQYDELKDQARTSGFSIDREHAGRTLLEVSAPASVIRSTFATGMLQRESSLGTRYFAPAQAAILPPALAALGAQVVGLDQKPASHPNHPKQLATGVSAGSTTAAPQLGTGYYGALTPADLRKAYNATGIQNGGKTVALFELSSATYSDIVPYANAYGLNTPTLQMLGSGTGDTSGADEVILDIDMVMAISNPAKIIIYTAPNNSSATVAQYAQIADDHLVQEVSSSWYYTEGSVGQSEYQSFQKMAAEGMTLFACSGDSGAYNGNSLAVFDPASQPFVTGVGATLLTLDSAQNYLSESAWGDAQDTGRGPHGTGSGGGISGAWTIPSYQQGIVSSAPAGQFSTTMRNVPDVSLAGDYDDVGSSYAIYYTPPGGTAGWYYFSGTSAATPIWAGFWSLIDEGLDQVGASPAYAGFANPLIYSLAKNSTTYARDFHDVSDGTTNLYYRAVTGYDVATGWGSFNAGNLQADVISSLTGGGVPAAPTALQATAGVQSVTLHWTASATSGVSYSVYQSTAPGAEGLTAVQSGISGTTTTVTGLTDGTTYYFVVRAVAAAKGYRSYSSNEVSAKPILTAPQNLTATSANQIALNWTGISGVTYNVYMATTPGGETGGPIQTGVTGSSTGVSGLVNGQTYYFKITAVDSSGESPKSNEASAIATIPPPSKPLLLTATAGNTQISLTWYTSTGTVDHYNVYEGLSAGGEGATPVMTVVNPGRNPVVTITGLTNGTQYFFTVSAVNAGGSSPVSNEASATPSVLPPAPQNLRLIAGPEQMSLGWTAVSGATSYNIYQSTTAGGEGAVPVKTGVPVHSVVITGLTDGTKYFFQVSAVNAIGEGARSSEASGIPGTGSHQ